MTAYRLPDAGWCEWCAGLGDWWEGPLGQRRHVVCAYCRGQGEYPGSAPPDPPEKPAP